MSRNIAAKVGVAKIKVKRDKYGMKWCVAEIARYVEAGETETPAVSAAVAHMLNNPKANKITLSSELKVCTLNFFGAVAGAPTEVFKGVNACNYRLKRGNPDEPIRLSFDFMIPLDEAKRWLIPAIGDEILLQIEEAQQSFTADA